METKSVLCISDILWEIDQYDMVERLITEIETHSPSLVLFGGDVINDGGNADEHVEEFLTVLEYLDEIETVSYTISGNHDEYSDYPAVVKRIDELSYAEEISGRSVTYDRIRIAGVPYSYTNRLGNVRTIAEDFPGEYDIVLAHAARARRVWLFDLDTRFIVTGHFAEELCQIQDTAFVSMGSYPANVVSIKPSTGEIIYTQRRSFDGADEYDAKAIFDGGKLAWEYQETNPDRYYPRDLQDSSYADLASRLIHAKNTIKNGDRVDERAIVEELLEADVPKTHIREYIHRYDFL
jgi:hypothetical protein